MEFCEYMKNRKRMCEYLNCKNCSLSLASDNKGKTCAAFERDYPTEAEAIVRKWSEEHPEKPKKTRQSEFLKQYPNAVIDEFNLIKICPITFDAEARCCGGGNHCAVCRKAYWLTEIE